jgi:hypothetical protein
MDTSAGSQKHGNGHAADPLASPPSAEAAPTGAPVSASPNPKGEKPTGTPDDVRDEKGRIKKGHSLNPKGRPPGIPTLNAEICRAAKAFKLGDRSYMQLLLAKSLQDPKWAELVIPRLFADATPPAPTASGPTFNNIQGTWETMVTQMRQERELMSSRMGGAGVEDLDG